MNFPLSSLNQASRDSDSISGERFIILESIGQCGAIAQRTRGKSTGKAGFYQIKSKNPLQKVKISFWPFVLLQPYPIMPKTWV